MSIGEIDLGDEPITSIFLRSRLPSSRLRPNTGHIRFARNTRRPTVGLDPSVSLPFAQLQSGHYTDFPVETCCALEHALTVSRTSCELDVQDHAIVSIADPRKQLFRTAARACTTWMVAVGLESDVVGREWYRVPTCSGVMRCKQILLHVKQTCWRSSVADAQTQKHPLRGVRLHH
jgi:hypothetical protein